MWALNTEKKKKNPTLSPIPPRPPTSVELTVMADPSFSIFWHVSFSMPTTQRVIFTVIPRSQFPSFLVKRLWRPQCRSRVTSMNPWTAFPDFQRSTGTLLMDALSVLKVQNIQKKGECAVSRPQAESPSSGGKNSKAAPLCPKSFVNKLLL